MTYVCNVGGCDHVVEIEHNMIGRCRSYPFVETDSRRTRGVLLHRVANFNYVSNFFYVFIIIPNFIKMVFWFL